MTKINSHAPAREGRKNTDSQPCFCPTATNGKREARVLWWPDCPQHPGAPARMSERLLQVPGWVWEQ